MPHLLHPRTPLLRTFRSRWGAQAPTDRRCLGRVSTPWRWSLVWAAVAVLCAVPQRGTAQVVFQANPVYGHAPDDTMVLTDQAPTGTITIENSSKDTNTAVLLPECPGGDYAPLNDFQHELIHERPQLDPLTAAWHNAGECAAAWLSGYPRRLAVPPHERRTITVRMTPPTTLPNGRYSARLIAFGIAGYAHTEVDITYLRGPWPRLHWRPTPPTGPGSGSVEATPAVVFHDSTRHATFTLQNRSARPAEIWLTVDCPWFVTNIAAFPWSSQYESAWHGRIPDLAAWIGNLPQHLVLAPHERRTIPLELTGLDDDDAANDRYARIVYTEAPVVMGTSGGDSTYTTPSGAVTVVYRAVDSTGRLSKQPAFRLSQPVLVSQEYDGNSVNFVCDTLLPPRPGIGFLARLHVAVTDAQGRPLPPTPHKRSWWLSVVEVGRAVMDVQSTNVVLGDPVWALDTLVSARAVTSNRVLDKESVFYNKPKAPDPVCVALPGLKPGHYQFVMEAAVVEDTVYPVRMTSPIEIP